jgi:hypothetical protein
MILGSKTPTKCQSTSPGRAPYSRAVDISKLIQTKYNERASSNESPYLNTRMTSKTVKSSLADLKLRLGQMRLDRSQKDSSIDEDLLEYENRKKSY